MGLRASEAVTEVTGSNAPEAAEGQARETEETGPRAPEAVTEETEAMGSNAPEAAERQARETEETGPKDPEAVTEETGGETDSDPPGDPMEPNLDKPELKFCHFAQDFIVKCLSIVNDASARKYRKKRGASFYPIIPSDHPINPLVFTYLY